MPRVLPIALIAQDSSRLRAYLNAFHKTCTVPSRVLLMRSIPLPASILDEATRHNYNKDFFDLSISPELFYKEHGIPLIQTDADNINDISIYKALLGIATPYILFTGGGIVSRQILNVCNEMVHIHPGKLPQYRGSTCFYYSLLQENELNTSAIFLREKIDTGAKISSCSFSINYFISSDMPYFMDHVLDPFIRAEHLATLLQSFPKDDVITCNPQPEWHGQNYYVMHPMLRAAAVHRINSLYDKSKMSGVFLNTTPANGN